MAKRSFATVFRQWVSFVIANREAFFRAKRTVIYYGYEDRHEALVPQLVKDHFAVVFTGASPPMPIARTIACANQLQLADMRDNVIKTIMARDGSGDGPATSDGKYGFENIMGAGADAVAFRRELFQTRYPDQDADSPPLLKLLSDAASNVFWHNHIVPRAALSQIQLGTAGRKMISKDNNVPQRFLAASEQVAELKDPRNAWREDEPFGSFVAGDIDVESIADRMLNLELGENFKAERRQRSIRAMRSKLPLEEVNKGE
jgi:hypothetical protein